MEENTNKQFCSKCGTELETNAAFCPKCGERCEAQSAFQPTPIQQYNMNIKQKNTLKDKIDVKKTVLSNVIPVGCLVVGIILFFVGLGISVPSDYISSYSMTEYVGGDAYNFIIEASLRGGRIAAAQISKGIYICVGLLIACVSALKINVVKPSKENE